AALRFDPMDVGAIAEAMVRIATDEALRRDLIERGRAHVRQFRWRDAARRLVAAYRRAREGA
ncbi:MAG: glycosyltransferase family 1 protein, partial [Candidatus Sumerlaeota bacterium]|nr:glycosyltransferase family 1 protein [Candidatus Sumerlaeota bacterium]